MPSTAPAHLSSKTDNWPTPLDFFTALDAEFGFVLDVCASTTNHKAGSFYALDHPDESRRDGLASDWAADAGHLGGAVWMNPPYGRPISAWMAKAHAAAQAGATVVTLVPVRADTTWWHEHVLATGAEVRYVRGRLTFGDAVNTAAFASAVVIYRPTDVVGAPGPVNTMPAHPVAAAAHVSAAVASEVPAPVVVDVTVRRNTPGWRTRRHQHANPAERLDCITCQWQSRSVIEHVFEKGSVEAPLLGTGHRREGAAMTMRAATQATPENPTEGTSGAATVNRVDELTTHLVASIHDGSDNAAAHDPVACLDLVRATVARRGGIGRTYKSEAAVQHLFSTVWQYGRFFAPYRDWHLVDADPRRARLTWRQSDPFAGSGYDVVDVVSAAGHPDVAALPRPDAVTVRLCNLANRSASLLWQPGADSPQPWAAALDPIFCSMTAVAA